MIRRILSFLRRVDSINIAINTFGNYLNVFFIAIFALILVRIMSPVEYGVLSVLLGIVYVMANVLDFGVTANIYSTLPMIFDKNKSETFKFLKSNFLYQSVLSILVIIFLILFFPKLDALFFKTGESQLVLNITAISILFLLWQNTLLNVFFAAKKFFHANLYLNLANVVKTVSLGVLIYMHWVNVGSIIFTFAIIGPLFYFIFTFFGKRNTLNLFFRAKTDKKYFKFKYSFPYFVGTQFFNMGLRMDLFLLSFFSLGAAVGYYGLAQKIVLTILSTIISITQVLSPNFSKTTTKKEAISTIKNAGVYLGIPILLYILLYLTPNSIFYFVFTEQFSQTAAITRSLVFPYIFFAIGQIPFLFLLYVAKKTSIILVTNVLFFVGMTAGNYYLIPQLGAFAPSYVISFLLIGGILIQSFASFYEYKKLPE